MIDAAAETARSLSKPLIARATDEASRSWASMVMSTLCRDKRSAFSQLSARRGMLRWGLPFDAAAITVPAPAWDTTTEACSMRKLWGT